MKDCIVVAHYNENLAWVSGSLRKAYDIRVYSKANADALPPSSQHLQNVGRESHTYLHHILDNYELIESRPEAYTFFCQGDLPSHTRKVLADVYVHRSIQSAKQSALGISTYDLHVQPKHVRPEHMPRSDFRIRSWKGNPVYPNHFAESFQNWFERVIPHVEFPLCEKFAWFPGANFAVKNAVITAHPKAYYEMLLDEVHNVSSLVNPEVCHFFERAWFYIFTRPLRIVCVSSPNYEPIASVFRKSLSDVLCSSDARRFYVPFVRLIEHNFDIGETGGQSVFKYAIFQKLLHAQRVLSDPYIHDGQYIVVSDMDIQFFKPMYLFALIRNARARNLDYYGMGECFVPNYYNGGFYIIKKTEQVRRFYADFVSKVLVSDRRLVDQEILNELLAENTHALNCAIIDPHCVVWGPHTEKVAWQNAVFHHAVCTSSMQEKLKQLSAISQIYKRQNQRPTLRVSA